MTGTRPDLAMSGVGATREQRPKIRTNRATADANFHSCPQTTPRQTIHPQVKKKLHCTISCTLETSPPHKGRISTDILMVLIIEQMNLQFAAIAKAHKSELFTSQKWSVIYDTYFNV